MPNNFPFKTKIEIKFLLEKEEIYFSCDHRHATFTLLVMTVDGVFTMIERLTVRVLIEHSRFVNYIRAIISIGITRNISMC